MTAGIGNLHTPNSPRNWLLDHLDLFADSFESISGNLRDTGFYDKVREHGMLEKEDFYFGNENPQLFMEGMPSKIPFELSQEGWCVKEAIRFMDEHQGKPFCMEVSLERPHQPFYPDQRFWDMYPDDLGLPPTVNQDPSGRPPHFQAAFRHFHGHRSPVEPSDFESGARRLWRGYLACITHVDHAVGLLLDYLDRTGLAENTLVIFTADHGSYSSNFGLMEKAPGICSEAVCRVPMLWRVPGVTAENRLTHQFVEHVDIAPTIASLCDLPPMDTVDGCDITPLLRGGDDAVREVAVTEHPWSKAIRWENWRMVHYQPEMFEGEEDVGELYDLEADPDESRNLYLDQEYQEVVNTGRRLLLEWLIRTARVKTVWPAIDYPEHPFDYRTAGDGKESNAAGPALRVEKGQRNYV